MEVEQNDLDIKKDLAVDDATKRTLETEKLLSMQNSDHHSVDETKLFPDQAGNNENTKDIEVHTDGDKADATAQSDDCNRETFKKPVLIVGPRKGPTKVKTLLQGSAAAKAFTECEQQSNDKATREPLKLHPEKLSKFPENKPLKENKPTLGYLEPSWSGQAPDGVYKMEVLKSGVIIEVIDLSSKSYHVVGRLPSCDISMAHPTISRFHAILQYRAFEDEQNGKGMYVYDMGSTHGTFWNGNRIKPKVYVRLQGGHMIRFGCSQRKFILQAPPDDQEPESEFSVTELKEIRRRELEERERLEKQRITEEEEAERLRIEKEETEGIDWGMGEDADEETDLTENPYAQTNNEELFLDDPKRTLRGWFEREGCDLQYQTEDKGVGRFLCWVDLPLDNTLGRTIRAEALVTGKKKEAVVQCALEACRILDRHGVLRQANHEAKKRKTRNWEEEDYYDSDEDNFLDRTGTIEKKREQRMRLAGKLDTKAETYDSLLEKHSNVAEKIQRIESTLAIQKLRREETESSNEDALDAFMSTLEASTLDKTEIRKMKIELLNLRKQETQLLKLINIAKPSNLPPLKPVSVTVAKSNLEAVVGNEKKLKLSVPEKAETISKPKENSDENKDSTDEREKLESIQGNKNKNHEEVSCKDNESENSKFEISNECVTKDENEIVGGLQSDIKNKKKKNTKRNQQRLEKAAKDMNKGYEGDEFREDYDMWVPPENQCGDGKTSLNEKFGY